MNFAPFTAEQVVAQVIERFTIATYNRECDSWSFSSNDANEISVSSVSHFGNIDIVINEKSFLSKKPKNVYIALHEARDFDHFIDLCLEKK